MFENLKNLKEKYLELEKQIADPKTMEDMEHWRKLLIEHADLKVIVEKYDEYLNNISQLQEDEELFQEAEDDDMKQMLRDEIRQLESDIEKNEEELNILLLPKDPNDRKNVMIEIRAAAGGDEAGLFAGELLRMYKMYADKKGWNTEMLEMSTQGVGGIKEAVMLVKGDGAYSELKYESGVHRVQRVPITESGGRIHTSSATVAVLPEAEDVDLEIDPNDIRVDVYRASGHGGQHVNTTDSAVRLTYEPTGLIVTCQDEKSQLKNKEKAMKILKARLYDQMLEEQNKEVADARKSQVGTGDRSERIRTYNFPQGRITDHRINKTIYQLDSFLDGDLQEMIDALINYDQSEKLKLVGEGQE